MLRGLKTRGFERDIFVVNDIMKYSRRWSFYVCRNLRLENLGLTFIYIYVFMTSRIFGAEMIFGEQESRRMD